MSDNLNLRTSSSEGKQNSTYKKLADAVNKVFNSSSKVVDDNLQLSDEDKAKFTEHTFTMKWQNGKEISNLKLHTEGNIESARKIKRNGQQYSVVVSGGTYSSVSPEHHSVSTSQHDYSHDLFGEWKCDLKYTVFSVENENKEAVHMIVYGYTGENKPVSEELKKQYADSPNVYASPAGCLKVQGIVIRDGKGNEFNRILADNVYHAFNSETDVRDVNAIRKRLEKEYPKMAEFIDSFVIVTDKDKAAYKAYTGEKFKSQSIISRLKNVKSGGDFFNC